MLGVRTCSESDDQPRHCALSAVGFATPASTSPRECGQGLSGSSRLLCIRRGTPTLRWERGQ
eukprot:7995627-Alexandrium_andersonii.AAC.1